MFKQNGIKHFFSIRIVGRRFNVLLHTVKVRQFKSAIYAPHASKSEVGTKTNLDKTEIIAINFHYANFHCGPIHAPRQRSLSVTVSRGQQPKDVMHSVA